MLKNVLHLSTFISTLFAGCGCSLTLVGMPLLLLLLVGSCLTGCNMQSSSYNCANGKGIVEAKGKWILINPSVDGGSHIVYDFTGRVTSHYIDPGATPASPEEVTVWRAQCFALADAYGLRQ